MIDFHSHILPAIDDGSKNEETSLAMLNKHAQDGVKAVVLTPHFYAEKTDPDKFLKKREESYLKIEKESPLPLILGAEVAFYRGISRSQEIYLLTLGKSDLLLLEMPFGRWTKGEIEEVEELLRDGLTPVLAHIERFIPYGNLGAIKRLKRAGCLTQMNAETLIEKASQKKMAKLISIGLVDFIGSDSHNLTSRSPNLKEGWDAIKKLCKEEIVAEMMEKQEYFYHYL